MDNPEKKVAIVTGGSRGIGFAIASDLVAKKFHVLLCSTNRAEAEEAAKAIGHGAAGIAADVASPRECEKLFSHAASCFGGVDVLVNNAGLGFKKPIGGTTPEEISKMVDVNVKGMLYCCRQAALTMKTGGAIVNISSFYGKHAAANASVYCATKFAVIGLSRSLAAELYPNIKVFVVCPGSVDTRMLREGFGSAGKADRPEKIARIVGDLAEHWRDRESGSIVEAWKSE